MKIDRLIRVQKDILDRVAEQYPELYLVGGTAISLLYRHRVSEDLDFFSQDYTPKFHKKIVQFVRRETGYTYTLIEEETRKNYVNMAVYEFEVGHGLILKIDFVRDFTPLLKVRQESGIASVDDVYYRKILAVIGWKSSQSIVGKTLAGGRQKTKDLFDIFYLSSQVEHLSEWFPKYFDQASYERLVSWYLGIQKQKTVMELLDLVDRCDTKAIFRHLDEEIIHQLNRKYIQI
ncbi:MAG: nucleotidyl transferase AbiEii/AbiGii toxin family protein [Chlamydiae bacterium]|nr:nucleotidyl transferase AbiEii/AbiGii toxin family protein [Chlamydiota bacterium]MBI3276309.1 nucleotidyl transferase AbiEii/AbiGii toxin family protein [Chlamydiota bacterium]